MTSTSMEYIRADSRSSNRSRTTERVMTMPAHAPNAIASRSKIKALSEGASDAAQAGHGIKGAAKEQRAAAAQAIGDGAVDQLPDGQADKEGRQRLLRIGRLDAKVVGDRRQTRQVHVDGERAKGTQNP